MPVLFGGSSKTGVAYSLGCLGQKAARSDRKGATLIAAIFAGPDMVTKILIYSNDPVLLSTRRLILEQAGAQVFATTDFELQIWFMAFQEPDILILCESLQMDQRGEAMRVVRELQPEMKVLVMMDEDTSCDLEPFNGEFFHGRDGPDALLAVVDRMLSDARPSQSVN